MLLKSGRSRTAKGRFQRGLPGTPVLDNLEKESEQHSPQKADFSTLSISLRQRHYPLPAEGRGSIFVEFCQLKSNEKWLLFYY
jgi:hypothetical protein